MLKFFISVFFLFLSISLVAQDKKENIKKDSIVVIKTQRYGLRVGADLSKIARSFYEKDYKGFEVVGDYRLTKKHYLAGEIGNENKTVDDNSVNFTTRGTYFKVGFDYNGYENWLDMENIIHVGLRYGASAFSQQLNSYSIYNTATYFNENTPILDGTKYDGLSAQWIEVVAGVKAELFNNVFIGFSFRLNYLASNKTPDNFDNLYIPGFNKTYGGKFGAGFNYTLTYFIPIYKVTTKKKLPASGTKTKK
jgi:TM2 domain-containing membrane protein YozV